MGIIKRLSPQISEKIAAGEVVDNPASVLRELIDNSIDANASSIDIQSIDGGKTLLRIADNGIGMNEEDLRLSIEKHTTSKIRTVDDIYNIHSLGFRGEALHAASVVSNLLISSSADDSGIGNQIQCSQGKINFEKKLAHNRGTTIEVKDLFYNIPARQRFLKSSISELRKLKEIFIFKALPHYAVEFSFYENDKKLYTLSKADSLRLRLLEVIGKEVDDETIELDPYQENGFSVQGFVSKSDIYKANRRQQFFFINRRVITSPVLYHAVTMAYDSLVPKGHYPIAYLFIEAPPDQIDVNIHPAKKEVKFFNESQLLKAVSHAIKNSLVKHFTIPEITAIAKDRPLGNLMYLYDSKAGSKGNDQANTHKTLSNRAILKSTNDNMSEIDRITNHEIANTDQDIYLMTPKSQKQYGWEDIKEQLIVRPRQEDIATFDKFTHSKSPEVIDKNGKAYKIIGSAFKTYVFVESEGELLVVDQHAAHERLNYERIKRKYKEDSNNPPVQHLLTPIYPAINDEEISFIKSHNEDLKGIGFEILIESDTIGITTLPYFMKYHSSEKHFKDLIDSFIDSGEIPSLMNLVDDTFKRMACRSSIMSGDEQSNYVLAEMLVELFALDTPLACPHGRPTAVKIKQEDMEKWFRRL